MTRCPCRLPRAGTLKSRYFRYFAGILKVFSVNLRYFGGILNQPHICILRKTINTSIKEDKYIMEQVLNKLYFTEFYDKKDNLGIDINECIETSDKQYDFFEHDLT